MKSSYDCVVVGGGPGGCSAAAITAEGGLSTLLIERDPFPRFHIGESLMPEVYWPLQRLGMISRMQQAGFQAKKSVQFVTHRGTESAPFFFREHDMRECSSTWQVERSEFDKMLFDRAEELGADCFDRTRLLDVRFDEMQKVIGVTVRDKDGNDHAIDCPVVIDATGQQSFIANKLGLRQVNPDLRKVAVWSYYRDALRGEGDNEGATIILNTESKDSWFWFIPLSRGITSIGCVGDTDYMLKGRGKPEQVYFEEMERCPGLQSRLENATRLGDIRTAKEFSYMTTQHAGDGWVLVGDALGFLDPVYSSGVYFALEMGVRAADAVVDGFKKNDFSASQLGRWTPEFLEGMQWLRKLVYAFYRKEFSIGRFMKEHPEHRGRVTDLLIGRIFDESSEQLFRDMDHSIAKAQKAM
ncbi:putative FAD-dependent oxidoreductase LodB [Novipirellula galeiformis]|uniref:Putative FAD-dependent oxidoreductase LodB n=1 Tax=Novipirellula galeiformis TaxID=2528004 RepID=A0A5C6CGX7_9BACT|nr:NAD(P)/FAD-dependent oxidoreductase [Novipirellula galeiformis]TWU24163.1 putative FAD-dependent oxidoreductase LodB [Novipirellula galeiformis]